MSKKFQYAALEIDTLEEMKGFFPSNNKSSLSFFPFPPKIQKIYQSNIT